MKTLLLNIWLLFAFVGTVFAADLAVVEVTPFNAFVTNTLQPLILSLLGVVVTAAVTYLTSLLKKKFGLEISEATTQRIRGIAWDAVHAVEERAADSLKKNGDKWLSIDKHSAAVNYILTKVPSLSEEEADSLVQAAVAKVKGIGATAEVGS